jgi:hypothetical protein
VLAHKKHPVNSDNLSLICSVVTIKVQELLNIDCDKDEGGCLGDLDKGEDRGAAPPVAHASVATPPDVRPNAGCDII